jgi:hypothetical protein
MQWPSSRKHLSQRGRGGGGALGPPLGAMARGQEERGCTPVGACTAWGEKLCLTIVLTHEDDEYIAHLSNNYCLKRSKN